MKKQLPKMITHLLRGAFFLILLCFAFHLMSGASGQQGKALTKAEVTRANIMKESARADVPITQQRTTTVHTPQVCTIDAVLGTAPPGGATGSLANRLSRPGTAAATCAVPTTFPGVIGGTFLYNVHILNNNTAVALCTNITLHYVSGGTATVNIQHAAYMAPFAPADISIAARYLADPSISSGNPPVDITFGVNIPANTSIALVVWNANASPAGQGAAYQLIIDQDAFCGPPAPIIGANGSSIVTEGCSPANGGIDPGETVTVALTLKNTGAAPTTNLVATLAATGGVTNPSAPQNYGVVASGASVTRNFTFTADGSLSCGAILTATLQLNDNGNPMPNATFTFTTGALVPSFSENFDAAAVPALPAGWTADQGVNVAMAPLWQTSNSGTPTPVADSLPNSAFTQDPANTCDNRLYTPSVMYSAGDLLLFRQNYDLEQSSATVAFDCGVLEMSTDNGASWQDIVAAGGTFASGGYNHTSVSTQFSNPLLADHCPAGNCGNWSGISAGGAGGFESVVVNLPASSAGVPVKFRWRMGSDSSVNHNGWRVDNVSIAKRLCCAGAAPAVSTAVSRKTHGAAGDFNINLPLTGTPGRECRTGGASNDYTMVVTFTNPVTVNGSPQAQVTSGTAVIGTGGVSNGGAVTVAGAVVTIPLTSVANAQTITVTLSNVNDGMASGNVAIPMSILVGDTNGNGAVNASDITQTKVQSGAGVGAGNFRTDVTANGSINASDINLVKLRSGTSLP
jgi:hypothetical protein